MKAFKKKLSSFSQEIQDAIIKIVGPDWIGLYKEQGMSNKAPAWFQAFEKRFNIEIESINAEIQEIKQDIKDIKNCPTIKTELQELNK